MRMAWMLRNGFAGVGWAVAMCGIIRPKESIRPRGSQSAFRREGDEKINAETDRRRRRGRREKSACFGSYNSFKKENIEKEKRRQGLSGASRLPHSKLRGE